MTSRAESQLEAWKAYHDQLEEEVEDAFAFFGLDSMAGEEFEAFLSDLFCAAGFQVERTGGTGDLGCDLLLEGGDVKFAVQAKRYGEERKASRQAVSSAVTAAKYHDAEAAIAITNRKFSDQTKEFAEGRCHLIGRHFLGKATVWYEPDLVRKRGDLGARSGRTQPAGTDFESAVARWYKNQGYSVKKIGGSGDFGADLLVKQGAARTVVQAKRHASSVGRQAVSDAYAAMDYYDCQECAVVTDNSFTSGARELAEKVGCDLIEGADLDLTGADIEAEELDNAFLETRPADVDAFLDRLTWHEQLSHFASTEASMGESSLTSSLSFLAGGTMEMEPTISYRDVPPGTWLSAWPIAIEAVPELQCHTSSARQQGPVTHIKLNSPSGTIRFSATITQAVEKYSDDPLIGASFTRQYPKYL